MLTLRALGAAGITLNRLTQRYSYSDGSKEETTENISFNIPAGSSIEEKKEIVISEILRNRLLAGVNLATFTLTYEFSGYDTYSNPVRAAVSILVEIRSTTSEEGIIFTISAISLQLPIPYPSAYNLNDEIRPDLIITATGKGAITGRIFIDGNCIGGFTQAISENTTLRLSPIITSIQGRQTLRVELRSPTFLSTAITYEVNKVEDPIISLSGLVLLENIAELSHIDVSAAPASGRYTLNGSATISIISLGMKLPVNISNLEISLNTTNLKLSIIHSGRVYAQNLADKLFSLFEGLLPIKEVNFGLDGNIRRLTLDGRIKLPAPLGIADEFKLDKRFEVTKEGVIGIASARVATICKIDCGIFNLRLKKLTLSAFIQDNAQQFALSTNVDFSIPTLPALKDIPLSDMLINPAGSFSEDIVLPSAPTFNLGEVQITLDKAFTTPSFSFLLICHAL